MKDATKLINSTVFYDTTLKMINPPTYHGSTVLFQKYEDMRSAAIGKYDGISYGTDRLPTQRLFEESIKTLEGGFLTRAFQSGISAIIHTLLAFTKSGDHILVCDNVYGPTARFCRKILSKYNIEVSFYPSPIGSNIFEYFKDNTRLIFLESPGSNTFEIPDIPLITTLARERQIITVLDNTWATPLYCKPFELGVDISIQSVTKYISGHSDLLLGTVTINDKYAKEFEKFYSTMEIYASPDDCYTALRGLKTLPVRLRQHEISALEIANWLETSECVDKVIHPALHSHPEHELWKRDFNGSSGLFSFILKEEYAEDKIASFINSLDLFGIGYSWGGFKSLITAGQYKRYHHSRYSDNIILRLNIGLEDVNDLIYDLKKGFLSL